MRNRAEKRHNDWKKAVRKRRIFREQENSDKYDNLHQYSKNKIFCLSIRAFKTNNKGKHRYANGNYAKSKNWSITDQRKLNSMHQELEGQILDNEENF